MPAAALDYRGEFVALRHLHADAGDIDVGDLVSPALIDEVPIEADRTARQHDFAVDNGFVAARASADDPEQLAAEAAEASRVGTHDIFLEQLQKFLLFLRSGGAPIAAENKAANAGHVEIGAEQLAEAVHTLRWRHAGARTWMARWPSALTKLRGSSAAASRCAASPRRPKASKMIAARRPIILRKTP